MNRFTPLLTLGLCAALSCFAAAQDNVPASVTAALKKADDAVAKIVAIPDGSRTFLNTVGAMDDIATQLDTDTAVTVFMQFVSSDPAERDAARAADEAISDWQTHLLKRADLFAAVNAYASTKPVLQGEQERLLEFTLRDFRREGMALDPDKRKALEDIEDRLNKLYIEFDQNIDEDETTVPLGIDELAGVNPAVVAGLPHTASVYMVQLTEPLYEEIMEHDSVEVARQKIWALWRRRGGTKNLKVLSQILKLRSQEANLLGYDNYADYVLEPRMAKNAATVAEFYKELRPIVDKKAKLDYAEFLDTERKISHNPHADLHPWDVVYIEDQLAKTKYAVDFRKVQEYLPVDRVVKGLFGITQSLYGITFHDITGQEGQLSFPKVWAPDVKFYEVSDNATGKVIGHFYCDLFPRPGKYSHAACWSLWERKVWPDGSVQLPLSAIVANLSKPLDGKPALLSHDDTVTFFHEFGHNLHNLLTETTIGRFSGTSVEQDFVEAPSQMFENWVWTPSVLQTFARHYKTGEPFPPALLKNLRAARTVGSGLDTEGQFFLGLMDQRLHTAPRGDVDTEKVMLQTYRDATQFTGLPETYMQASFGHLTGYGASYYGYEWSLVYSADMFQRFEQLGLLNPKAGMYYRRKILSHGGSSDAMDMLVDYLGRKPNLGAYLRQLGIDPDTHG